jgi:hypothetical protein
MGLANSFKTESNIGFFANILFSFDTFDWQEQLILTANSSSKREKI